MTKRTKIQMPHAELRAALRGESAQAESRTVEATFYTGAEVVRQPMFDEPYLLSFSMDPKHARLDRVNAGAPVLDSHDRYSGLGAVLGRTSNGRIENGLGLVDLQFSNRTSVDAVWQDVQDGILGSVSMGANIYELTELDADPKSGMPRFQATDWEVTEVSLVAVPADAGARITLSDESAKVACSVHYRAKAPAVAQNKESNMDKNIKVRLLADCEAGKKGAILEIAREDFNLEIHTTELELAKAPVEPKAEEPKGVSGIDAERKNAELKIAQDKERREALKSIASYYGMDELWVQRQHNLGVTLEDATSSASLERAKQSPVGPNSIGFGNDYDAAEYKTESMAEAIVARANGEKPSERAKGFYGLSFVQIALETLALKGKGRGLDARADASRILSSELALHTTSDFPLLLANAMNKMLLPEYNAATPTYRSLAEQKQFNDFRAHNFLRSGDFPNLLQVNEHGEFKYGTMGENNEPVTAATYGRVVGLSRQTLINDDLSAFSTLATKAARRVADFENSLFFSTCITAGSGLGPDLSDGDPVYDSNHANVNTGGVLSNTTLESAFALMMAQTSIDGLKLNTMPAYLLTSPTSYGLAKRLLSAINPTQASEINTFAGMIQPIADANLTGVRYYVLANPSVLANYVYGYIGGQGPRTEVRQGFEVDGVEFKLALDFGVGAIEYRAGVTGAGS